MEYPLLFSHLLLYNSGEPGITVPVFLRLGETSLRVETKLDTGATYCIFQRIYGKDLGINIESGAPKRFGTATGSFLTYGHWITLSVHDFDFDVMVYFAVNDDFKRDVLGRHGFLDRMLIGLDDYAGKLYLRHNDDNFEIE
ncbi:MAG TPA: hypothetical protein VFZ34_08940 [Blastocatellia bacterium]|nr:hypothetical protein [Blastocatellia bacterium]